MKQRPPHRGADKSALKSKLKLETFSFGGEDHAAFKASMQEAARAGIAEFPKTLELVKEQFRQHHPIDLVACFAGYGLITTIGSHGADQKPLKDIQQQHVELLQAIMLTIPVNQWGPIPVVPATMQVIFDNVPKLADTFFLQRLLDAEKVTDEQELEVLSLQERIRMHTMGVRNWGYFGAVVQIAKELYSAVDTAFAAHHGFSCTDFIEVMRCVVSELETRQTEHWRAFRKVMSGRNPRQIFRNYFKYVPGLIGNAEQMLAALPGISVDQAQAAVMAHYDLRLASNATFKPDEIAKVSGRSAAVVQTVLRAISLTPGSLVDTKTEFLFLGNPIWEAPAIDLGDSFFVPMPQAAFSHIHRIMEKLAGAAGLKEAIEKRRAEYLENKLEATLRSALPGANITRGAKWKLGDQVFETDVLAVIDRTVIAAEAKANRLTPEGLRGAPARVKRHVQDMVLTPSIQSERLANVIAQAQAGDPTSIAITNELGIDAKIVDRVIRISVTLDDLSVLSSAEADFKKVGWVPADHELAPTILIADLLCIVEILNQPILLLHYLSERGHFQKAFNLLGDELDFLGLYLESGFNLGVPDKDFLFTPTGMSAPIDAYYNGRDAGIMLPKPKPKMSSLFSRIIERLNERRPMGWTTVGLHLLGAASPSEQRRLERELDKLRTMVRKNWRDPAHINSVQMQPPQGHKARVGFHLFPEQMRASLKKTMEALAAQAVDADGADSIVLFARSIEKWDLPYEAVVYVKRNTAAN